jgi:hypothetical protein
MRRFNAAAVCEGDLRSRFANDHAAQLDPLACRHSIDNCSAGFQGALAAFETGPAFCFCPMTELRCSVL